MVKRYKFLTASKATTGNDTFLIQAVRLRGKMQLQRIGKACANHRSPLRVALHGPGPEDLMHHSWLGTASGHQSEGTWLEGSRNHLCEQFLWKRRVSFTKRL